MMTGGRWMLTKDIRPTVGRLARTAALIGLVSLPLASGCTSQQTQGSSPAYLIIVNLGGGAGPNASTFSNVFDSDVITKGTVFGDIGQVVLTLGLKDPGSSASPTTPTSANFITMSRYHVQFVRADGRNTPGVDVPNAFDGSMTLTVTAANSTGNFVLVPVQAKLEAPLAALAGNGGNVVISTIATITFYGTDQAGRAVSVTGTMTVNFADFADPQ